MDAMKKVTPAQGPGDGTSHYKVSVKVTRDK